ncbi:hypothetical protein ACGFS9_27735 [Streptomyces sp. NPDC048566]|uniref:hypothetical protein n=1 Tax=Streptomyces sp. NPDC048566 TaxID=3365569 RepID=UPI0037110BEB
MTSPAFRPTHVVPQDGLPAWESPDPSRPTAALDALLPVQLVDRLGDWARIVCANGWSAWVDGRLLVGVPQTPPAATGPVTRTADPRPLLAQVEEALARYREAAGELASGRLDGEEFRARTQGRRIGVVVDGESMWLYDGAHERWVYCDGARLSTFAAERSPGTAPRAPAPETPGGPGEPDAALGSAPGPPPVKPPPPARPAGPESEPAASGPGPDPERRPAPDRGHEPTRVVAEEPAEESGPARGRRDEETRAVPEAAPGGHEPTRVVAFDDEADRS